MPEKMHHHEWKLQRCSDRFSENPARHAGRAAAIIRRQDAGMLSSKVMSMIDAQRAEDRQVLTGGVVLTMNPGREIFSPGVIVIDGTRLVHVGPAASWPEQEGDRRVDCTGHVLMPGLVNTHTHACMALFRGLAEDRPRAAWAPTYTLPHQERAIPDDYYWGTLLGGAEMLTNGITTTADRFSLMATIAEALDRTGMRAVVCHTLWDIDRPLEWDQAMALTRRWGVDRDRRVHCGIGPHAPDTCSDALLRRVRVFAHETGARIFIHCAQSENELASLRGRGYTGAVRCLAANDALGPDLVAAHCIYVDGDEIAMLADSGTWVSHCPVSNAKVEGRMPPIAAMLRRGVRLALGTDWAPTNNGMDLFDEMKSAGILNKVAAADPEVMPVDRLLAMATIDAARALGLDRQIGSVEPGKRADVIALAMDGLHLQPWQDIAATLVYSVKGLDVRHVWVDGRLVVQDRRLLTVDADSIREEVARIWRRLRGEGA